MITEVLLDMDGVLVDFIGGAGRMHGISDLYADRANYGKWNCNEFLGLTYPEFIAPMRTDFWANLDWMPDGRTILNILEDRFGEENICLLSDPSNCGMAMEGKMLWIKKHMPKYLKRYLMGPAKFFAGSHNRMLVDDRDLNIDEFQKRKLPTLQVPRRWNRLHFYEPVEYVSEFLDDMQKRLPVR